MAEKMSSVKKDNKSSNKNSLKYIGVLAISIVIVSTVILAAFFLGGFDTVENLLYYSRMSVDSSVVSDGKFPVSFTGNDIISVKSLSSKIFVLSEKMLTCISDDGKPLFTETFTFIEPQLNVGEKYGIVFDRSSSAYIIFNTHGVVFRGNTEGERHIIAAAVDKKGNCALSVKSDDSACRVYFIDKNGEIKYIWSCSEEYVVSLDISSEGKRVICGALGSFSNEIYTKVYCLNIDSDSVACEYKIDGSACMDVIFTDKNKAAVSCIDRRVIFDLRTGDGNPVETYYSGSLIQFDRDFRGNTVVITDKINSLNSDEITMYDKNNTVAYRSEIDEGSDTVSIGKKHTYCLAGDNILVFKKDGTLKDSFTCEMLPKGIVCVGDTVFTYNVGTLKNNF